MKTRFLSESLDLLYIQKGNTIFVQKGLPNPTFKHPHHVPADQHGTKNAPWHRPLRA